MPCSPPGYAREIQANEERWRALMENVHLAVVGLDPDGRIDYVNPFLCNLLGYPRKELLGRPITALVAHTEIRALEQRLESAARSGPRPHSRWTLVCASGERRQLAWSSVQLRTTDGEFAGILSVGADMTDQLEAQRDLQQMQRDMERLARVNLMGELAAALAHELNQPLTAILSNAQAARRFLAAATPDLAELREILEDIIRDDKRAGEVIHRLRAMLRKGEVARQRFDLNQALREVVGLIAGELGDQGVELREDYASDLPPVAAGRVEIQQVVMNLLLNALRAVRSVPQGRRQIQLASSLNGREALVSVRDSGPGIHPDELSSIFDVFFTSKADGLGMGLAISRRIIEAHGARIWAENPEGQTT
jgi:two-component system sensor kinase FixL